MHDSVRPYILHTQRADDDTYICVHAYTHTHTHTHRLPDPLLLAGVRHDGRHSGEPVRQPQAVHPLVHLGSAIFFGLLSAAILVGANGTQFREVGLVMPLLLGAFICKHHTLPPAMSLNHHLVSADSRVPNCRVLTCAGLRSKGK